MLAEMNLPFELSAIAVIIGLLVGAAYGALAERSKFCLRRALAGVGIDRQGAFSVWIAGFASAMIGTQLLIAIGIIDLSVHRLMSDDIPFLGAILGGLIFGTGMILTRGCISRLTVLTGTGNLRAILVVVIFGLVANATLKGVFAPLRVIVSDPKITLSSGTFSNIVSPWLWCAIAAIIAVVFISRNPHHPSRIVMGALIGLIVPLCWYVVSVVLFDEFDPKPIEGLSFTLPHADLSFWFTAATAIPANFGIGLILGVMAGALISALTGGRFEWQSFETPRQTGRYALGALMMGFGGVLAGGCSVGAGLAGMAMQSFAALLALGSIMIAGFIAGKLFP